MSSILNYFPRQMVPRPSQRSALLTLEENWDKYDVFVLNLPVAAGKSALAVTLGAWRYSIHKERTSILTPSNILVQQYMEDHPTLHTLKRIDEYKCTDDVHARFDRSCSAARTASETGKLCAKCPYKYNLVKSQRWAPVSVYNYYTYLAARAYTPNLIVDESHNLLPYIQEMEATKLWQHQYGFPTTLRTYGQLYEWTLKAIEASPYKKDTKVKKLLKLKAELEDNKNRYLIHKTTDFYHGQEKPVIKLLPIDVRDAKPVLWPIGKVRKIILLSATINKKTIEMLGLDRRRVLSIESSSNIAIHRRPLILPQEQFDVSYQGVDQSLPGIAEFIRKTLREQPEKGFIHATYKMAGLLRAHLADEDRLIWHTAADKSLQYRRFQESDPAEGKVLVASGMYEGVDLPQDMGRWQVITKVPWPSLAEPAIKYQMQTDEEWYAWQAIKDICQAYGRICRGPDDFGKTIIIDRSFKRLYNSWEYLFPQWFREAVEEEDSL